MKKNLLKIYYDCRLWGGNNNVTFCEKWIILVSNKLVKYLTLRQVCFSIFMLTLLLFHFNYYEENKVINSRIGPLWLGGGSNRISKLYGLKPETKIHEIDNYGMSDVKSYLVDLEAVKMATKNDTNWKRILSMPTTGYHSFNAKKSDEIGNWARDILESRDVPCRTLNYSSNLPTASIIIIFHNEARSTLLRTINTVYERTPPHLLKEIILVDDASTFEWLLKPLEDYMARQPKAKLIRMERREGLIRSRLRGALEAKGDVLVFIDAHSEVNRQWLEPLVSRIKENRKVVAVPDMDPIHYNNMHYMRPVHYNYGGFTWDMYFKYVPLPKRLRAYYREPTMPVASPTMVGCAHAVDRKYFFESGAYDTSMEIWGGENIEHSFRIWMCGGRVEILRCSKIGHIFKPILPYSFRGDSSIVIQQNFIRMAEVWMDEYKHIFYATQKRLEPVDFDAIHKRRLMRKQLKCKSFAWYLKNVFPDMPIPQKEDRYFGKITLGDTADCLDVYGKHLLSIEDCDKQDLKDGHFRLTDSNFFKWKEYCLILNDQDIITSLQCTEHWDYLITIPANKNEKVLKKLRHRPSGKCLTVLNKLIRLTDCNKTDNSWIFDTELDFSRHLNLQSSVANILAKPKNILHFGWLKHRGSRWCLNIWHTGEYDMVECRRLPKVKRILQFREDKTLMYKNKCLAMSKNMDLMVTWCRPDHRGWTYKNGQLQPPGSILCLTYNPAISGKLNFGRCDAQNVNQLWTFGGQ